MFRSVVAAIGFCVAATHALAADPVEIGIGYLGRAGVQSKLSLVEQPAANDGIAGARLGSTTTTPPASSSTSVLPLKRSGSRRATTQVRQRRRSPAATDSSLPIFRPTRC